MYISKNWLSTFVHLPPNISAEELAKKITLQVAEVEELQDTAAMLENIVVGKVTKVEKHPNADKLNICTVDVGGQTYPVVCGGSNVREGMKVAMGLVGAQVRWHGEGDLVELKKTKIRGEVSEGMICAADEIGLGEVFPKRDKLEILDMSDVDVPLGMNLAEALELDDIIFDIDNKTLTHRPDLWGHYGMARDVAALLRTDLQPYTVPEIEKNADEILKIDVKEPELCPRYMGVIVDGITVGPSPEWLRQRITAVGINSVNNIVDITNYVMLELGQPMHAFDAGEIADKSIIVRNAEKGETFTSLDEKEYDLTSDMLVIADKKRVLAVAGVKGANNSGVTEKTRTIIFEAANFNATSVRRTATALSLRTDASSRFEKSLDPHMVETAMRKAVALTLEICPNAKVASSVVDVASFDLNQGPINLNLEFLAKKIGVDIPKDQVISTLVSLGFGVEDKDTEFLVTIPTWRATKDISIPEDLVEEIARIYGYDNIPATLPPFPITPPPDNHERDLETHIRNILALECGYTEVMNYSFVAPEWIHKLGESTDKHIELDNPIAKNKPLLRRNLVPGLLENMEANLHRYDEVAIFEIGSTYLMDEKGEYADKKEKDVLPKQDRYLGIAYAAKGQQTPFFVAKDALDQLAKRLGLSFKYKSTKTESALVHPGRYAEIHVGKEAIGRIAEVHPAMQKKIGLGSRTAIVQININTLLEYVKEVSSYEPLSQFPAIERDVAFVVDKHVTHQEVEKIFQEGHKLIRNVHLFDVYQGDNIDEGKKSMAYRLTYRSDDKTLESEEVEKIHEQLVAMLEKKVGAEIRK